MHTVRFLPARARLPSQREGRARGRRAVGAMRTRRATRWTRYRQGPNGTTPTMILDLLDTGTARREWRRGSAQAMGLSKRGRRNGAETEGHTGAWAQWSRAAQCRRCDEGQGSAEIAGRRGRRSGRGKRMDTVQERAGRGGRAARQACRHGPELCRHDARGHRGALSARCAWSRSRDATGAGRRRGQNYSPKRASITATRSFSTSMSC